jgi:hypothetical protein
LWRFETNRPKPSGSGSSWDELDLSSLESEVFLLGHWKNFEELEENLSIDELNALVDASRKKEEREMRFLAAINGVDLDGQQEEATEDVTELQGRRAADEGFGAGEGLEFLELEG